MKTADEYGGRLGRADLDDIDGLHASIRVATDIRSDLYSLGVTLWEMLSGKVPFSGSAAEADVPAPACRAVASWMSVVKKP